MNIHSNSEIIKNINEGKDFALIPPKDSANNFSSVGIVNSESSLYIDALKTLENNKNYTDHDKNYISYSLRSERKSIILNQIVSYTVSTIDRYCFDLLVSNGILSNTFAEDYVYGIYNRGPYTSINIRINNMLSCIYDIESKDDISVLTFHLSKEYKDDISVLAFHLFKELICMYTGMMPLVPQNFLIPTLNDAAIFMARMLQEIYYSISDK